MVTFVHKKHYKSHDHKNKMVITYSLSEVAMGVLLLALSAFYIYDYLTHRLDIRNSFNAVGYRASPPTLETNQILGEQGAN